MKISKICKTCEFNFDGICAGKGIYGYGEKITDMSKECNGWGISLEYYSEVINRMPWYIKEPFERGKIYFNEALHKLEEDETEKGTQINIYDAIEKNIRNSVVGVRRNIGCEIYCCRICSM